MFDLHRHDEFSTFDGFGNALDLAHHARELGHTALCTTNHGNTSGLVKTYMAAHEVGIKPILGVEGYFLPKHKEKTRGYHLVLIAKDFEGYRNINRIQFLADKQRYYNPIWDFRILREHSDGLICTTACIASYTSQAILKDRPDLARRALSELRSIFGDDLYVEIQPYKVSDEGAQERVNREMLALAMDMGIKPILTSDSHFGSKDDFPTYLKMHEIGGHDLGWVKGTYEERYMPEIGDLERRFAEMHGDDYGKVNCRRMAVRMMANLDEIEAKCDGDYLDGLKLELPRIEGGDGTTSRRQLVAKVKRGLRERGCYTKPYIDRCKEELRVITHNGFVDYFLIVADYVNWAKEHGIAVGPGRGSVCNSLVAYALRITEVDSLHYDLDFRRFLRMDKVSFPDIDLDFETDRRSEVIDYLTTNYDGMSARICSYGLYKVDNLLNDLAKVCGYYYVDEDGRSVPDKGAIKSLKSYVRSHMDGEDLDADRLLSGDEADRINYEHDDILVHFSKLYRQVRYIGTHAAGIAITGGELLDYTSLRTDKDGNQYCSYDLTDLEGLNIIKFDILGLRTMQGLGELRSITGRGAPTQDDYTSWECDAKILGAFDRADTDGVFQFETDGARSVLTQIGVDDFKDVVAATSMNRPGPLSLHMPDAYASAKGDMESAKSSPYYDYASDSYGTLIYQEQIQRICMDLGGMSGQDADKVMKAMKGNAITEMELQRAEAVKTELKGKFVEGAVAHGYDRAGAGELFDNMLLYTFNKGHAIGYSLISLEEMYYKVYHPTEYWYVKMKYARNDREYAKFASKASADGTVVFIPHVNYSLPNTSMRKVEGEHVIQEGLTHLDGVGSKAAQAISNERKAHGFFRSKDDFLDRVEGKGVNRRVLSILDEWGASDFDKSRYMRKVQKYNTSLYSRSLRSS